MPRELIPRIAGALAALLACLVPIDTPLCAQARDEHREAPIGVGLWQLSIPVVPGARPLQAPAGTISAELLRYPLSSKARGMLRKALHLTEAGNHPAAIRQLQETLSRYPSSAAYVQSLLGIEYLKTNQVPEAVRSFEVAVSLLPHDALNRTNFGLSLAAAGQFERAKKELCLALDLDHTNSIAKSLLEDLLVNKSSQH